MRVKFICLIIFLLFIIGFVSAASTVTRIEGQVVNKIELIEVRDTEEFRGIDFDFRCVNDNWYVRAQNNLNGWEYIAAFTWNTVTLTGGRFLDSEWFRVEDLINKKSMRTGLLFNLEDTKDPIISGFYKSLTIKVRDEYTTSGGVKQVYEDKSCANGYGSLYDYVKRINDDDHDYMFKFFAYYKKFGGAIDTENALKITDESEFILWKFDKPSMKFISADAEVSLKPIRQIVFSEGVGSSANAEFKGESWDVGFGSKVKNFFGGESTIGKLHNTNYENGIKFTFEQIKYMDAAKGKVRFVQTYEGAGDVTVTPTTINCFGYNPSKEIVVRVADPDTRNVQLITVAKKSKGKGIRYYCGNWVYEKDNGEMLPLSSSLPNDFIINMNENEAALIELFIGKTYNEIIVEGGLLDFIKANASLGDDFGVVVKQNCTQGISILNNLSVKRGEVGKFYYDSSKDCIFPLPDDSDPVGTVPGVVERRVIIDITAAVSEFLDIKVFEEQSAKEFFGLKDNEEIAKVIRNGLEVRYYVNGIEQKLDDSLLANPSLPINGPHEGKWIVAINKIDFDAAEIGSAEYLINIDDAIPKTMFVEAYARAYKNKLVEKNTEVKSVIKQKLGSFVSTVDSGYDELKGNVSGWFSSKWKKFGLKYVNVKGELKDVLDSTGENISSIWDVSTGVVLSVGKGVGEKLSTVGDVFVTVKDWAEERLSKDPVNDPATMKTGYRIMRISNSQDIKSKKWNDEGIKWDLEKFAKDHVVKDSGGDVVASVDDDTVRFYEIDSEWYVIVDNLNVSNKENSEFFWEVNLTYGDGSKELIKTGFVLGPETNGDFPVEINSGNSPEDASELKVIIESV
jgi:hypothetical protein